MAYAKSNDIIASLLYYITITTRQGHDHALIHFVPSHWIQIFTLSFFLYVMEMMCYFCSLFCKVWTPPDY